VPGITQCDLSRKNARPHRVMQAGKIAIHLNHQWLRVEIYFSAIALLG
jgi:hypothetical protein